MKNATKGILAAAVITGGMAAGVLGAIPAHADSATDQAFIKALAMQGIIFHGSDADEVAAGKAVCTLRRNGYSEDGVANLLIKNSGLTPFDAGYVVGAAEAAYCPSLYGIGTSLPTDAV